MKKKNLPLVIIGALLVIAVAVWAVSKNSGRSGSMTGGSTLSTPAPQQSPATEMEDNMQSEESTSDGMMEEGGATMEADLETSMENDSEVREISMIARQWEFVPSTIEVESGQPTRLIIENKDVDHGFFVPQLGIDQNLPAGETTTIEFTANQPGTYSFSCDVFCGQGHSDMTGQIIVN